MQPCQARLCIPVDVPAKCLFGLSVSSTQQEFEKLQTIINNYKSTIEAVNTFDVAADFWLLIKSKTASEISEIIEHLQNFLKIRHKRECGNPIADDKYLTLKEVLPLVP